MSKSYRNKPDSPRFDYPILKKGGKHERSKSRNRKKVKQKLKSKQFDNFDDQLY